MIINVVKSYEIIYARISRIIRKFAIQNNA